MAIQGDLWMYAMDAYGNIITKQLDDNEVFNKGFSRFNHSSFNAGADVICAGMIYFQKGKLLWIDNNSGHYKPTKDNLKNAVNILAGDGADLASTIVGIPIKWDNQGDITAFDLYTCNNHGLVKNGGFKLA